MGMCDKVPAFIFQALICFPRQCAGYLELDEIGKAADKAWRHTKLRLLQFAAMPVEA